LVYIKKHSFLGFPTYSTRESSPALKMEQTLSLSKWNFSVLPDPRQGTCEGGGEGEEEKERKRRGEGEEKERNV
jgi:hypothetical protein